MYNPDKQARAAGGKFGGKVATDVKAVEAAVETLASDVIAEGGQLIEQTAANLDQSFKTINERINQALPGEFVRVEAPAPGWGKIALAALAVVILVATVMVLTGCISVRH
jgi:hypothetical protein